ncbi:MAG: glycosyltransferase family 4 protein [Cyanobacteria bacterium J06638_28]
MASLLLLAERFPPDIGGVARSAGRIAAALANFGLSVRVLTWSRYLPPGEVSPSESLKQGQVTVYRLGLYRHWDMTLPQTLNVLEGLLDRSGDPPALIWGHYLFPAGFMAVYFGQLKEIPTVVSARGNDIDRAMFPPGDFARLQWTLAHATAITTVSQDMVRKIQILSDRTAHLHRNVVNPNIFCPSSAQADKASLKQTLGIAKDAVVLGFSGELREKKGQQFLLEALAQVHTVRPAYLLIIGELRTASQTLLQNFRSTYPAIADRILVTGHLESPSTVAQHLQICDVYLQPSLWEGLPNALLEAMACGCLCIASDAGGMPEVITSGQQGFLLPRSQLQYLGKAVLEVLSLSAGEQAHIRDAARQHICSHYSPAQEKSFLSDLLTEMGGCL